MHITIGLDLSSKWISWISVIRNSVYNTFRNTVCRNNWSNFNIGIIKFILIEVAFMGYITEVSANVCLYITIF